MDGRLQQALSGSSNKNRRKAAKKKKKKKGRSKGNVSISGQTNSKDALRITLSVSNADVKGRRDLDSEAERLVMPESEDEGVQPRARLSFSGNNNHSQDLYEVINGEVQQPPTPKPKNILRTMSKKSFSSDAEEFVKKEGAGAYYYVRDEWKNDDDDEEEKGADDEQDANDGEISRLDLSGYEERLHDNLGVEPAKEDGTEKKHTTLDTSGYEEQLHENLGIPEPSKEPPETKQSSLESSGYEDQLHENLGVPVVEAKGSVVTKSELERVNKVVVAVSTERDASEKKYERGDEGQEKEPEEEFNYEVVASEKELKEVHIKTQPTRATEEAEERIAAVRRQEAEEAFQWNAHFQQIVEEGDNDKLFTLAQDFVYAAMTYGRIIISEYYLEKKTIQPVKSLGGVAGGDKYLCQNILFKFAVDVQLTSSDGTVFFMYGGARQSTSKAMLAAGHDLKGLMNFYNAQPTGVLHYPLMALIDYKGFRLSAQSFLPISKSTIKYGSCDGGKFVHNDIPELHRAMAEIALKLNIKPHYVGRNRALICGPGDIEGHLGSDGKFYVCDFARVFPPEAPDRNAAPNDRSVFYKMLRPELVLAYPKPLSSDAFTGWGMYDMVQNNTEVREATQFLYDEVIPEFATWLDALPDQKLKKLSLTEAIHRKGINCRHLGRVRAASKNELARRLLLTEMVARLFKNKLRLVLRRTMRAERLPSEGPYRVATLNFLNYTLSGERNFKFWRKGIKKQLESKFTNVDFTESELDTNYDLKWSVDFKALVKRFQFLSGVKLSETAEKEFLTHPSVFIFLQSDVVKISARVKHLNIVHLAGAKALFDKARTSATVYGGNQRLWEQCNAQFATALASAPSSAVTLLEWGTMLAYRASIETSSSKSKEMLTEALEKLEAALQVDRYSHAAMYRSCCVLLELAAYEEEFSKSIVYKQAAAAKFLQALDARVDYMGEFVDRLLMEKHRILKECDAHSTPGTKEGLTNTGGVKRKKKRAERKRSLSAKKAEAPQSVDIMAENERKQGSADAILVRTAERNMGPTERILKEKEGKEREKEKVKEREKDSFKDVDKENKEREQKKEEKEKEKEKVGRLTEFQAKLLEIKAKAKEKRKEKERAKELEKEREKELEKEREREREREKERERQREAEREFLKRETAKVVEDQQQMGEDDVGYLINNEIDSSETTIRRKRGNTSPHNRENVNNKVNSKWKSVDEIDEYHFTNLRSQEDDQINLQEVDLSEMKTKEESSIIKKQTQEKKAKVPETFQPVSEEKFVNLWLCFQLVLKVNQLRSTQQLLTSKQLAHLYYQAGEFLSTWASFVKHFKPKEDTAEGAKTISEAKKNELKLALSSKKQRLFSSAAQMYEAALKLVPCVSDGNFIYTITNESGKRGGLNISSRGVKRKKVEELDFSHSKKKMSVLLPLELVASNAVPISVQNDIDKVLQEGNNYFCGRLEGDDVFMVLWYPQGRFVLSSISIEFSPSHKLERPSSVTVYVTDDQPESFLSPLPLSLSSSSQNLLKLSTIRNLPDPITTCRIEQPAGPAWAALGGSGGGGVGGGIGSGESNLIGSYAASPAPPPLAPMPSSAKGMKSPRGERHGGTFVGGSSGANYPVYSTTPRDVYDITFDHKHTGNFVIIRLSPLSKASKFITLKQVNCYGYQAMNFPSKTALAVDEGFELLAPIGSGQGKQGVKGAIAFTQFIQMAHNSHILSSLLNAHIKAHVDTLLKKQRKKQQQLQQAQHAQQQQEQMKNQTLQLPHSNSGESHGRGGRRHHRSSSMPSTTPNGKDTVTPHQPVMASSNPISPPPGHSRTSSKRSDTARIETPPEKTESLKEFRSRSPYIALSPEIPALDVDSSLRNYSYLSFKGCALYVNDELFQVFPRYCYARLQALDLSSCKNLTDQGIETITAHCGNALVSLNLNNCTQLGDDAIIHLTRHATRLASLKLPASQKITNRGFIALAESKALCGNLETFHLPFNFNVTDKAFERFFKHCERLKDLALPACKNLTDKGLNSLARHIIPLPSSSSSSSSSLSSSPSSNYSSNSSNSYSSAATRNTLTRLDLSLCNLITVKALADVVKLCAGSLRVLLLKQCKCVANSEEIFQALAHNYHHHHHTHHHSHHHHSHGHHNTTSTTPHYNNRKLEVLSITSGPMIRFVADLSFEQSFIKLTLAQPYLTKLNLTRLSNIGDECVVSLIKNCIALESLVLSHCYRLTSVSLMLIPRLTRLKRLDLDYLKKLDEATVIHIVSSCMQLQKLTLRGIAGVTDKSLAVLAQNCGTLKSLALTRDRETANSLSEAAVLLASKKLTQLRELYLSGCPVSDRAVISIANNCPYLETLALWTWKESTDVSDDAIFYLVTMCPKLRCLALPWEEHKGLTNTVSQECERIIKKMNPRLIVDRFLVQILDDNSL